MECCRPLNLVHFYHYIFLLLVESIPEGEKTFIPKLANTSGDIGPRVVQLIQYCDPSMAGTERVQYCNVNTEVCCRLTNNIVLPNISGKTSLPSTINGLADVTAGKSSVTGSSYKFSGSAGSSPGQIQVLTDQYDDVKPQVYNNGESGSHHTASSNKTTRDVTLSGNFGFPGTIDYSGVEFPSDVRFASTIRGPAYLPPLGGPTPPSSTPDLIAPSQPTIITYQPSIITTPRPIQTTRNTCPPGTILTPSGLCETLSTPIPPCPFGTIRTPDGNCEAAVISTTPRPCPPGTILTALGSCEAPRTPTPACPYGTILTPDGSCARPVPLPSPSPTPACPFGTIQKLDGTCERLSISTTIRPSPSPSPRPCPAGTFLTATGICEAPRSTLSCPIGTIRAIDGTCISAVTPTTPLPCPPGTILTAIRTCESAITPTPRPACPPGTIQTPSGICEQPIVSSTTVGYPSPCPPGTFRTLTGLCERLIATTARPECPPGTYLTPLGICETPLRPSTPKPPPRPFQTTVSRDYLPPVTPTQYVPSVTQKSFQPSITTEKPFRPPVTQKQPSITPYKPSITPPKPFQPSVTPQTPTETTKPYYPQFSTSRPSQPSLTTLRPYQPSSPKPNPFLPTQKDVTSSVTCLPGQIQSPSGCIYTTKSKADSCLPGQRLSITGLCEYPASTTGYEYPKPTATTSPCGPGSCIYPTKSTTRPNQSTARSCLPGQRLTFSGVCEPITTNSIEYTPPTTTQPGAACGRGPQITETTSNPQFSSQVTCKTGQVPSPTGYGCIYPSPSSTTRPSTQRYDYPRPTSKSQVSSQPCPNGQVPSPSGYGCVYPSSSTTIRPDSSSRGYDYPKPTYKPQAPSQEPCRLGQVPSPSGYGCVYPSSTIRPLTSSQGYDYPRPTSSPQFPSQPVCGPGQIPSPSGYGCIYPSSTTTSSQGYSHSQPYYTTGAVTSTQGLPQTTPRPDLSSKPSCGSGQVPSPSGYGCIYPSSSSTTRPISTQSHGYPHLTSTSQSPSKPSCQPGQIPSSSGYGCVYPSSTTIRPDSFSGYDYPKPTSKSESPSQQPCRFGQVPSPSGYGCVYTSSTTKPVASTQGYNYPKPTFRPQLPSQPTCAPGQILSPTGRDCIYPPSPTTDRIATPTQGYDYSQPTSRPDISSKPLCRPGQVVSPSGDTCIYPSSPTTFKPVSSSQGYDNFRPTSKPNVPSQSFCRPGQVPSPSGSGCVYPSSSTSRRPQFPGKPDCQPGELPSPSGYGCISSQTTSKPIGSSRGYDYAKPATPFCKPGQIVSPTGSCIYPSDTTYSTSPKQPCRPGQVPKPEGIGCEYPKTTKPNFPNAVTKPPCPFGTKLSPGTNECLTGSISYETPRPTTPSSCPTGQVLSPSGICTTQTQDSCRPGQIKSASGVCIYPSDTTTTLQPTDRPACKPGQILSFGTCVYPSQTTPASSQIKCASGQTPSSSGSCIPNTIGQQPTPTPQCSPGQIPSASGYGCIYPAKNTSRPLTCLPGQIPSTSGISCEYPNKVKLPVVTEPTKSCPFGTRLSSVTNECLTSTSKSPGYNYPKPSTPFISESQNTQRPPISRQCPRGQILSSSGLCVYSSAPTSTTPACGPGQILSDAGTCIYPTTKSSSVCGFGQILSPSGSCVYPSQSTPKPIPNVSTGYEYSKPTTSGNGYTHDVTTTSPNTNRCGTGQILSATGSCVYSSRPTTGPQVSSTVSCLEGQILSSGICTYPASTRPQPGETKLCKPGQILSESGTCYYPAKSSSTPSCLPGQVLSSTGVCIYPSQPVPQRKPTTPSLPGYSPETTSTPSISNQCAPGQTLSENGVCIFQTSSRIPCKAGQKISETGTCYYPPQPTSRPVATVPTGYKYPKPSTPFEPSRSTTNRECGPGQILSSSGICIYPSSQTSIPRTTLKESCKPGQLLSNTGTCYYPSTSEKSCGPGQVLSSTGSCVYPIKSTPQPFSTTSIGYKYSQPSVPFPSSYPTQTTIRPTTQCGPGQILLPSGICSYSSTQTTRPDGGYRPSCPPGQEISESGECSYPKIPSSKSPCSPGQILSFGSCVYPSQPTLKPTVQTTTGYDYSRPSTTRVPNYTGRVTTKPGTDITCGVGQILSSTGLCIYATTRPQISQKPSCRPGQELSESGTCFYPARPSPKPTCGPGQILSPFGSCIYPSSTTEQTPTTSSGYEYSKPSTPFQTSYPSQTTAQPSPSQQCRLGQILSPSGVCIYPASRTTPALPGFSSTPSRRPTSPSPDYSTPATVVPSTGRQCNPGQVLSEFGTCIYQPKPGTYPYPSPSPTASTSIPSPKPCGPGQVLSPEGRCTYISTPRPLCQPGQVLTPSGTCVSRSTPRPQLISSTPGLPPASPKQCPPGSKPSAFGSGCEYPRPTAPTKTTTETFTGYRYPKPDKPFESQRQCPPGKTLSSSGICESFPLLTATPRYETNNINQRPCPPGSKLGPSGVCQLISSQPSQPIDSENAVTCPIGTIKTLSGLCERTTTPSPQQCPFGTRLSPTGSCEITSSTFNPPISDKSCPPGTTKTKLGSCEPSPSSPNLCPPGSYKTPNGDCKSSLSSTTNPSSPTQRTIACPPGSSPSPSGICQYPSPTPFPGRPSDTNNQITPSYPTKKPYRPSLPPSSGYYYETPTPTFGYPSSTLIPNSNVINNQYVLPPTTPKYLPPPPPDRYSEVELNKGNVGSRIKDTIRLPDRRPTTERPDNNVESVNNINVLVPSTRLPFIPELNNEPPVGCAAALKCVQEIYCTAEGVVSPVPVVLTKDQELLRVPTTECRDIETGIIGKCCRDPNYKDPWPSANLVNGVDDGQYKENNFYGQQNILGTNRLVRASNSTRPITRGSRNVPKNSKPSQPSQSCGERNKNTQPEGPGPIDANFAEYPWQAMILRDSNRSLLCGGAIIRRNAVLTTAHCLEGLETSDVLIKGGEWKLGIDEEPLPFQIVKVGVILRHPEYVPGSYKNDLAVLVLRENLRPAKNVGPICLPSGTDQAPKSNCVATGWGKRILQLHAKGAIMHHTNVNVMDSRECQQTLEQNFPGFVQDNYGSSTFCGKADIDHCKVDYGSALACADSQGHYTLAGIYTWDTGCKSENQIGGYIAPDVNWIESTLAKSIKELKMIERQYLLKTSV
ncbi:hypothetical protein NQ315_013715 [Exocentrus adspersus]|uniref:Peptidase S1 domain-containing protein n=1 Tax=Exocentrus adspersus TaxID=1586481 RepID=A0AAV8W476_9CUCU|nr:hypothetical protein NQ315_013715 [Exocentrus adspersus]